jgi:dienelactone hydrolase
VGTNNIDSANLHLLAQDARAAVNLLKQKLPSLPIGLLGFSQAGWIIPLAATDNPLVQFMVLFSGPTPPPWSNFDSNFIPQEEPIFGSITPWLMRENM